MLVGPSEVIEEGRRVRKMFGGGMRQVGVLCAAAMVALDEGIDALAEDHGNALRLAEGIAEAWGTDAVDPESIETNIVYISCGSRDPEKVVAKLADQGIKVASMPGGRIRAVTHRDVDTDGIDRAIAAFANC
jgi:threonine aldolase